MAFEIMDHFESHLLQLCNLDHSEMSAKVRLG